MLLNIQIEIDESDLPQLRYDLSDIKRSIEHKSNYYKNTLLNLFNAAIEVVDSILVKKHEE